MHVHRRSFVKGLLGSPIISRIQKLLNTHNITVNFYFDKEVRDIDDWRFDGEDVPFDIVESVLRDYTRVALSTLETENSTISSTITVHTDNFIDISKVKQENNGSTFKNWRSYLDREDTIPQPNADANILLTTQNHHRDLGRAEYPCSACSSHQFSAGVVYEFSPFDCVRVVKNDLDPTEDPLYRLKYSSLVTALHEVGHTIGLNHEICKVTENSPFAIRSTLMMSDIRSKYDLAGKTDYREVRYNTTADSINTRAYNFPDI